MKESFVLYIGMYEPIKTLSLEEKGKLLDALFEFNISGIEPDKTCTIFPYFLFFKNQFRLDNIKYEKKVEANRNNGLLGGRPKKTEVNGHNPNNPLGLIKPKKAYKENDKENENENGNELSHLPMFAGIESLTFLDMCREVSMNGGKLKQVSLYKKEYYQLIANNKDLQKQTGRDESWLVNAATKFIKDHAAVNQEWANYADFFKHFLNWTRKQPV